ncbi:hypothetical protein IL306_008270 [Fusarium sp. DS 682]|nr:hypothetical protein IL306_008270 [Fusarium sp. DS 682]
MSRPKYVAIVLNLGEVFINYTTKNTVGLSPSQIASALDSPGWHDYERGNISELDACERIARDFKIDLDTWIQALEQIRYGVQANLSLICAIVEMKQTYPTVKICCLSNIPRPELELLRDEIDSWGIIDQFFASSDVGQRKPDIAVYEEFLKHAQLSASSCIFVDDKVENFTAAQILGFKGIVFFDNDSLIRALHNAVGDPVARARIFLKKNAKEMFCTLDTGPVQSDNYSQLIILQNTGDRAGSQRRAPGFVTASVPTFFVSSSSTSGKTFCQESTSSFVVSSKQELTSMEVVTTKVQIGYFTPFLISALVDLMRELLATCVQERMGRNDNVLDATMRVLSAESLGLRNDGDLETVLQGQQLDGGWELAWLWGYGSKPLKVGSRGVVTAMAMNAIQRSRV